MEKLSLLQEALFTIKKLKQELNDKATRFEPVAIIGLSCRFPQASNKNAFWELLEKGKNIISKLPEERLALLKGSQEYAVLRKNFPYWGGYLSNIELFDPYFFSISPREALLIDPQQRFLLEAAYEAIEDAGLNIERLAGSNTGVFVSMYPSEFLAMQSSWTDLDALYLPTGNAISMAANRLSYQLDLHGPSFNVDTACSSSLVAAHLACNALRNKECDIAILASVKINLLPSFNYMLAQAKMLSPDGQCKTFDAHANGYVQGEGVGALILKPLAKALKDNDQIYAVIAGSAINQDGKTNGLTAPNGALQEALLKAAYSSSRIDPAQVGYIECHGTGTSLGDPIEVEALENVIGKAHQKGNCWIGSLKTNIGHLEPAAGIASLIKVALALQQGKIPPHLNFSEPNPHIPFEKYHFQIPQQVEDWPLYGNYRIAGISSFGFGGMNGHLVIRSLSEQEKLIPPGSTLFKRSKSEVFTLSVKDPIALEQLIRRWCAYLEDGPSINLSQLCYNVHLRRSHYAYRLAIIAETIHELYQALSVLQEKITENFQHIFIYTEKDKYKTTTPLGSTEFQKMDLADLAKLYVVGEPIDWVKYEELRSYPYLEMPLYPWQHKAYWPKLTDTSTTTLHNDLPWRPSKNEESEPLETYLLGGKQVETTSQSALQFSFVFDIKTLPELADTYNLLHVGYYLEMLSFVTRKRMNQHHFNIKNLVFLLPIHIPVGKSAIHVDLVLEQINDSESSFKFYKCDKNGVTLNTIYVQGILSWKVEPILQPEPLSRVKKRCTVEKGNADTFSARIKAMSMPIQSTIKWTESYWLGKEYIIAKFRPPLLQEKAENFSLKVHPGLFDGCVQPLFMLLDKNIQTPYIAAKIDSFQYLGISKHEKIFLITKLQKAKQPEKYLTGDWYLIDAQENIIAFCKGIELIQIGKQVASTTVLEKPGLKTKYDFLDTGDQLINFLREQISYTFSMPINEVSNEKTLWDMGMNSLMAVFLSEKIEEKTGVPFPVEKLLRPINIQQISESLSYSLKKNSPQEENFSLDQTKRNTFVSYAVRRSAAKIRLFCFPYGGAGASIYKDWHRHFSGDVEVVPVQLPGRETLYDVNFISNLQDLIQLLYSNLENELTLPFAFFGHSFGSLIAFELTRYLRNHQFVLPKYLFVSAYPAPHLPKTALDNIISCLKELPYDIWRIDLKELTNDQLHILMFQLSRIIKIDQLSLSPAPEARWLAFLPRYLNDMRLVKEYHYSPEKPLNVPITAFYSSKDELIAAEDVIRWNIHTAQIYQAIEVNGGHLFIDEEEGRKEVLQIIEATLARLPSLSSNANAINFTSNQTLISPQTEY